MDEPNRLQMGGTAALLSVGLTAAWIEAAVGIGTGPGLFNHLPRVLLCLAVTGLVLFLLAIPLWGVVSLFARRAGESHGISRALGSGAFLGNAAVMGSMAGVMVWPLYNADLLRWAVIAVISVPVGFGAGRTVKGVLGTYSGEIRLARMLFAVPAVAAVIFLVVWWVRYRLESVASVSALAMAGGLLVSLALIAALGSMVRKASTSLILLGLLLLALILAPGWSLLSDSRIDGPAPAGGDWAGGLRRVILISIDTLRADALSAYGEGGTQTPNIDALAGESLVFDETIAASPWTLPSLATLVTGVHPDVHGMRLPGARLPDVIPTLAGRMRRAGYRTAFIGSNPHLGREAGLDRGFDQYIAHGGSPPFITAGPLGARLLQSIFPPAFPRAGSTHDLTEITLRWLRGAGEEPFFLWLHYLDPHVPHTPPVAYLPAAPPPEGMGPSFSRQNELRNGYFKPDARQREWIRQLYLAEVRYVDAAVGRVLKELGRLGLDQDALIILTSDHGEEFWEHGGYEHGHSLHRETLRVPLMIKAPGVAPGRRPDPVSLEGVAPTILDLAGISREEATLLPPEPQVAEDPNASAEPEEPRDPEAPVDPNTPPAFDPIVSTALLYHEDQVGIRFGEWKYVRPLVTDSEALFDLAVDPGERTSVAANRRDKVEEAAALLREHYQRAGQRRSTLGVEDGSGELDDQTLEQLRSLGYVD